MRMNLAVASILTLCSGVALAADLPYTKAPPPPYIPPPPPMTWNGFYAGLNIGGGWSNHDYGGGYAPLLFPGAPGPAGGAVGFAPIGGYGYGNGGNNAGVVGGGQLGYNYQLSSGSLGFGSGGFLVGLETDFQGTSIGDGFSRLPWFGTVRGRLGYLFTPTLLLYGTGGFAYGESDHPFWGVNEVRSGWAAGGGVEWMFMPNWSAKVEYLFLDLASCDSCGNWGGWGGGWGSGGNHNRQVNIVRAGVNYHFNWAAPAPVLAKY